MVQVYWFGSICSTSVCQLEALTDLQFQVSFKMPNVLFCLVRFSPWRQRPHTYSKRVMWTCSLCNWSFVNVGSLHSTPDFEEKLTPAHCSGSEMLWIIEVFYKDTAHKEFVIWLTGIASVIDFKNKWMHFPIYVMKLT